MDLKYWVLEFYAAVNDLTTNLHLNDNDDDVKDDIDNDVGECRYRTCWRELQTLAIVSR